MDRNDDTCGVYRTNNDTTLDAADQASYDEWLCEQYEAQQASELTPAHYSDPVDFMFG